MAADALLRGFTITPGEILGHQGKDPVVGNTTITVWNRKRVILCTVTCQCIILTQLMS